MSKKTPNYPEKKTKLVRSKNPIGLWLGGALIIFGLLAVVNGVVSLTDNKTRLLAPEGIFTVEVVETNEEKARGLSNRESINSDAGMLFVFEKPSVENCFWMKDMRFSIDMVWLNEQKEVVTVVENVSPGTYPAEFCPSEPAKYGLEVRAGRANQTVMTLDTKLRF
jgi:uncharacterized membrane protein (UPF0127 family)